MIPVQNIYYMLAYAFQILNEKGYKSIATEKFKNTGDLCAEIISKGVSVQLKRGLGKDYVPATEDLTCPRGKIEVTESIKRRSRAKGQIVCTHDEYTENFYLNRIIKTTMLVLLSSDIDRDRKKKLRKLLVYFNDIDTLDIHTINWNQHYNRNNQTYRMLVSVCYMVVKGLLQSRNDGTTKVMDFFDEQRMHHLYEKFILEYYRKEHKELQANPSPIEWQLDDDNQELLPMMKTDITLTYQDRILIIDAKYYEHSLQQSQYDKRTVHSGNMYQIFTYVKNKEAGLKNQPHNRVAGMLLYAQTEDEGKINEKYSMSGNLIMVKTLNLNENFSKIQAQLDDIAQEYLEQ